LNNSDPTSNGNTGGYHTGTHPTTPILNSTPFVTPDDSHLPPFSNNSMIYTQVGEDMTMNMISFDEEGFVHTCIYSSYYLHFYNAYVSIYNSFDDKLHKKFELNDREWDKLKKINKNYQYIYHVMSQYELRVFYYNASKKTLYLCVINGTKKSNNFIKFHDIYHENRLIFKKKLTMHYELYDDDEYVYCCFQDSQLLYADRDHWYYTMISLGENYLNYSNEQYELSQQILRRETLNGPTAKYNFNSHILSLSVRNDNVSEMIKLLHTMSGYSANFIMVNANNNNGYGEGADRYIMQRFFDYFFDHCSFDSHNVISFLNNGFWTQEMIESFANIIKISIHKGLKLPFHFPLQFYNVNPGSLSFLNIAYFHKLINSASFYTIVGYDDKIKFKNLELYIPGQRSFDDYVINLAYSTISSFDLEIFLKLNNLLLYDANSKIPPALFDSLYCSNIIDAQTLLKNIIIRISNRKPGVFPLPNSIFDDDMEDDMEDDIFEEDFLDETLVRIARNLVGSGSGSGNGGRNKAKNDGILSIYQNQIIDLFSKFTHDEIRSFLINVTGYYYLPKITISIENSFQHIKFSTCNLTVHVPISLFDSNDSIETLKHELTSKEYKMVG
jgi:hypothetical protein